MDEPFAGGTRAITEGEWAGWRNWGPDAFEDHNGPFFYRVEEDSVRCAFRAQARHMNGAGIMHGGCVMTFADYAAFCIAYEALAGEGAVTVSMNTEFVGAGRVGDLVEATGEVVKAGGSMIFVRGKILAADRTLAVFSAVLKKIGKK